MLVEQIWTGNAYRNFNYLIACEETGEALAVDPLDHEKCLAVAKNRGWEITQIVNTHEHGDHVAGVLRSDYRDELAPKTILTKDQVRTLSLAPQLPEITLTPAQARDYIVVDYELILPVAPGIVLIKSPGHTHGHQMVYVQLAGGQEFLFIGDIGWSLDNIIELKLRPAATIARVKEDPQALMHQMTWIKQVMDTDGLIVVPSHDDRLLTRYAEEGLLGTSL